MTGWQLPIIWSSFVALLLWMTGLGVTDYMEFLRRFAPLDDGLGSYRLYGDPLLLCSSG